MNLRTLAARDGSMLLAVAWTALGITGLVVTSSAGSSPWLLFPFLPAAVALVGAVRRPMRDEAAASVPLLIALVGLLLIWSLAALFGSAIGAGRQILVPSAAIGYTALAAAVATVFQVVLSRGAEPASAMRSGTLLSVVMVVAGLVTVVSPRAGELPACGTPAEALPMEVRVLAEAFVDDDRRATATVASRVSAAGGGADWTAEVDPSGAGLEYRTLSGSVDEGQTLDTQLESVIGEVAGPGTEDLGVEALDGSPARHCRAMVSGPQAIAAFRPLRWLVGDGSAGDPGAVMTTAVSEADSLPVWRGELDWWLGLDGGLLRAEARVGGHPADAWGVRGLRGLLRATLVVDPDSSTADREALP